MNILTENPLLKEILISAHQKVPPTNLKDLQSCIEKIVLEYFSNLNFIDSEKQTISNSLLCASTPQEAYNILDSMGIFGWQHLINMWGESWKLEDGSFPTFKDHQQNIFRIANKVFSGEVDFLSTRTAEDCELDDNSLKEFLNHINSCSKEQLGILNTALVFHDFGRIVTTGTTHPEVGSKLIKPFLDKIGLGIREKNLILNLTSHELRFGALPWGETIPLNIVKDLDRENIDPSEFLKLMSVIYIFDVASIGNGKLTQTHFDNARFLRNVDNIQSLATKWCYIRLAGFFLKREGNILETLNLTTPVCESSLPKDLIEEIKQNIKFREFLSEVSFLRIINLFRYLVNQGHQNCISNLLYIFFQLSESCLPKYIQWIHLSVDRREFCEKIDKILSLVSFKEIKKARFVLKDEVLLVENQTQALIEIPIMFPDRQTVILEIEGIIG